MASRQITHSAPAPGTIAITCDECGNAIYVGSNTKRARACAACKERRMQDNLLSVMSKSGPYYERMLAAQRKARERKARGRGAKEDPSEASDNP